MRVYHFPTLRPLLAALGPLLAALGSLLARLGPLLADLGASWDDLEASCRELGTILKRLDATLGSLRAMLRRHEGILRRSEARAPERGRRCPAPRVAPLRDFLRKFLLSRDLKNERKMKDLHEGLTTRRAALGAADLKGLRPHAAGPTIQWI